MTGAEACERILKTLRAEIRGHWGSIGRKEAELGRSRGYLSKISRGSWSMPLGILIRTLEILDVDPAGFFAEALGTACEAEPLLRAVERQSAPAESFRRLRHSVEEGAGRTGPEESGELPAARAAALAAALAGRTAAAQRRSLKSARKYRDPAFAAAYLHHLDGLRYRHPAAAARLAETVIVDLVPRLAVSRRRRAALVCRGLGVHASAQRLVGKLPPAAAALRLGLVLSRRLDLAESTAELLQRASYVMSDGGQARRALVVLREALEIYFDRELDGGVAKTLVDRGIMLRYAGSPRAAVRVLRRARQLLPERGPGIRRNREALYHHLVQAYAAIGDFAAAESLLEEAGRRLADRGGTRGRLAWQRGRIFFARGEYRAAELRIREACEAFAAAGHSQEALALVDLLLALLAQGRSREAHTLARERSTLLMRYRGRGLSAASLGALERAAARGGIHPRLLERIAGELQRSRAGGPDTL